MTTDADRPKKKPRHDPSYQRDQPTNLKPLSPLRLAQIGLSLPEHERIAFCISIDESLLTAYLEEFNRLVEARQAGDYPYRQGSTTSNRRRSS